MYCTSAQDAMSRQGCNIANYATANADQTGGTISDIWLTVSIDIWRTQRHHKWDFWLQVGLSDNTSFPNLCIKGRFGASVFAVQRIHIFIILVQYSSRYPPRANIFLPNTLRSYELYSCAILSPKRAMFG